jgi:hypothetical protein
MAEPTSPLCELRAFRAELHACLTRRADALFELVDALLSVEHVSSLPHLSLAPIHRRGWGSVYAALAHGCVDVERLQALFAHLPLTDGEPIYAVDVTTWPRCDAETSPERGFYYHPSRHSAGQPIVAGWAFQWIAQLSFSRDSWTAPVDAVRLRPHDTHNQAAITQVRALIERLPVAGPHRCLCSMPAMTPASSASAWMVSRPRSWGACGRAAALRRPATSAPLR